MPRLRWKRKNLCFAVKCLPSLVYNTNVKILQYFLLKTMWAQQMQGTENSQYSIYQHASDISVTFDSSFEFFLWKSNDIKKEGWEIEHLLPFIWDSFSQKTLSLLVIVVSPTKTYSLLHFLGYKTFWRKVYKSPTMKMEIFLLGVWPIFFRNQRGNGVNWSCCGKPICAKNSQSVITPQLLWISAKKPVWSLKAVFTFIWLDSFKAVRSYLAGLVEVDRLSANTMKIIICTFWDQTWIYIV